MLPTDYIDWLAKVREDGGELAWIRGRPSAEVNKDRRTREQLVKKVLKSLNVKNAVKSMAVETGRSEEELWTEANEIMQNMAHSFGLTSTKAVGYVVLKCLRRLLDKVMVNFEALQKVREIAKRDSVVFMPTHRTYVDFLLLSLLCYDQNLKLPAICAGADFLTSKFVGEALRRCGAFFIRRSFGSTSDAIEKIRMFIATARFPMNALEALGDCLILPVKSKWITTYTMLNNYMQNKDKVVDVLQEFAPQLLKEHEELTNKHEKVINAYVQVVQPIAKFIERFESEKQVTSSLILPVFAQLWYQLKNKSTGCDYVRKASGLILKAVEKELDYCVNNYEKIMFVSAYLDPIIYRQLPDLCRKVPKFSMDEIVECVKAEASEIPTPEVEDVKPVVESEFSFFAVEAHVHDLQKEFANYEMFAKDKLSGLDFWKTFEKDRLYWTLFTEYVQTHLVCNECPIEFFVEGQRSRTSKSLYPKFGLVQVIAEPFLRSHVYDTVVVPVTINYDRLLESFLYGRELLGSPKPKETVSGLLKVRQILNQKFGSVFITFAEPISLRQYFSRIDRASISFRPTAHYIYERSVKNTVAHLAHEVVNLQNKNNILTVWTIAASVLQQEFRQSKVVSRRDTLQKLTQLHELCRQLGFNLWTEQGRSMEDMFNYYVAELYHDLFKISDDQIQLLSVDAEKSKELPEELLREAIPSVVLANAANPFIYELSDFGFVLLACQNDHIKKQDLGRKFEFLRDVFEKEFVHKPMTSNEDLETILNLLQKVGIVRIENEFVLVVDKEKALWITKIVEPFLHAYSTIMEIILQANPDEQNGTLLQTCWKQLSSIVKQPSSSIDLAHLSSDLIKNVISLMNKVDGNQLDGEDNQKRAKQMILDLLNEIVNPTNKSVRSRI